jgi:tRNA threonylcarbamoyl adenosine modification protein YeaZ
MSRGQAERLMPLLAEVMDEAGLDWDELGAIGVGTGPGNFTGTRIAVAAARGLALSLGVPAEGVTAADAFDDRWRVVCLPAPRGAVHMAHDGALRTLAPADLPEAWPRVVTGPAAPAVSKAAGASVEGGPTLAVAIARIAARRAVHGRPRPSPVYLRPADAAPPVDRPPAIV